MCVPVLLWIGVIAWYNWSRFGDVTEFGYAESPLTLSAPLNFLGLIFSPGKGLLFYSPLIALGILGLPRMWKADANLVLALLAFFVALTCMAGLSTYWGDEVWGPRYIVPAAWTLLVPIAWWASTVTRQKVLAGVACLAVVVQVIGVSAPYSRYTHAVRGLTGVPVYLDRLGVDPREDPLRQRPDPLDPRALGSSRPERGPALLAGDRAADRARPEGHLRALRGPQPHDRLLRPALRNVPRLLVGPGARATSCSPASWPWRSWRSAPPPAPASMCSHSAAGGPGAGRRPRSR